MNEKSDDPTDEPVIPEAEPPVPANPDSEASDRVAEAGDAREPPEVPEHQPKRKASAVISPVAGLAFLLALVSLAGVAYLAWMNRDSGATTAGIDQKVAALSGRLDETSGALREARSQLAALDQSGNRYAEEIASLESRLDDLLRRYETMPDRLANLERSVSSLQGISAGDRDTWLLAEAEYYMQIANAQLQLAGNPELARLALSLADQRIRQLADPALFEVRRALSAELQALDAMEKPDLTGMTLTLANLARVVESLPLREEVSATDSEREAVDPDQSGVDRALESIRNAFNDIVSVRRTDEAVTPLMSPDAAQFLRANLALQLQAARLALLQGEQAIFEQSLDDALAWLNDYYAADSRAVQSAIKTISELKDAEFSVIKPDISGSLELLRQYLAGRTRQDIGDSTEPAQ